jgi:hypothetical protein
MQETQEKKRKRTNAGFFVLYNPVATDEQVAEISAHYHQKQCGCQLPDGPGNKVKRRRGVPARMLYSRIVTGRSFG